MMTISRIAITLSALSVCIGVTAQKRVEDDISAEQQKRMETATAVHKPMMVMHKDSLFQIYQ